MNMIGTIKNYLKQRTPAPTEMAVVEAYDIWSVSYDSQPGNLMIDLDELIFSNLIRNIDIENKSIADIGCGTGRHWQKLYERSPASITGYDVSQGMLDKLKQKFPQAISIRVTDNLLKDVPAASFDVIVSTLTIAHIENLRELISSWARVLKTGGEIIITDFHPAILAVGGKRSFQHGSNSFSVVNYIHGVDDIKNEFARLGFTLVAQQERYIDEAVRSYYENKQAIHIYNRYKGMPVIYGLHLKK